ncbi:hypothetical protein [Paenibacillus chitinolyticus]|uniref:hypothetical protein n=1 Tax=Paenibacillus chitinolyticus TaxID=79263 RepID=UPI00366886EC
MSKFKQALVLSLAVASTISFTTVGKAETPTLQDSQISTTTSSSLVAPMDDLGFSYSFSDLGKGSKPLLTNGKIIIEKKADVYITLVQWADEKVGAGNESFFADMYYELIDVATDNSVGSTRVIGKHDSENTTRGWSNIPKGTYKIKITNLGGGYADGNGFVRAYPKQ